MGNVHSVSIEWVKDLVFSSPFLQKGSYLDGEKKPEDSIGMSPKKMLLVSLLGCTGMDVVALIKKMRVQFTDFILEVTAELSDEHPVVYTSMHIVYKVNAPLEDLEKIEKAVMLSKTRYCGVSAMLQKNNPITFSIELI